MAYSPSFLDSAEAAALRVQRDTPFVVRVPFRDGFEELDADDYAHGVRLGEDWVARCEARGESASYTVYAVHEGALR